jgi:hypothetical protein
MKSTSYKEGSKMNRSKETVLVPRTKSVERKEQKMVLSKCTHQRNATARGATKLVPGRRKVEREMQVKKRNALATKKKRV